MERLMDEGIRSSRRGLGSAGCCVVLHVRHVRRGLRAGEGRMLDGVVFTVDLWPKIIFRNNLLRERIGKRMGIIG